MAGIENKAESFRKMVAFLEDLGADLQPYYGTRLARSISVSMPEMNIADLLYYQRMLEATIDNKSSLMNKEALKEELTEVVRERFSRGAIEDKNEEAREFRARLGSVDDPAGINGDHCFWCGSTQRDVLGVGCQRSEEPHGWHKGPTDTQIDLPLPKSANDQS